MFGLHSVVPSCATRSLFAYSTDVEPSRSGVILQLPSSTRSASKRLLELIKDEPDVARRVFLSVLRGRVRGAEAGLRLEESCVRVVGLCYRPRVV